ncbi:MAG: hypothetical protein Q4B28_01190 [bacterium]|nr:hypothetical protein [bacterium]
MFIPIVLGMLLIDLWMKNLYIKAAWRITCGIILVILYVFNLLCFRPYCLR